MHPFIITILLGSQIAAFSNSIVFSILETFKDYPYLLQGEFDYTLNYLDEITTCHHGAFAVARVENELAGFLLGCPLKARAQYFSGILNHFQKSKINISDYYYFTDIIVLPSFRNQYIATKLITEYEKQVQSWGYKGIYLFTVKCKEDHPLRPQNYQDIEYFYEKLGYIKTTFQTNDTWPTILDANGTVAMREHTLMFWMKKFSNND